MKNATHFGRGPLGVRSDWIHLLLGAFALVAAIAPLAGQRSDPRILTLKRIYASSEFVGERFGPARWLANGVGYTTLESSETTRGGRDIVRYDPGSGRRQIMVPASRLIPTGETRPLGIADYTWSADGRKLLVFTNTRRVWRSNTRGDYWVLDLDDWSLTKLGGDAHPASLMFAKFSPDARRVAYVRARNGVHDIYVEQLQTGSVTQITNDGSANVVNGTSDWVYEEEFSLRDCFRWSPDGSRIAYWQFHTDSVPQFYLINNTDSLYPSIISFPYPKAGQTNSAVRVGVVSAAGGATVWMRTGSDPRNTYIPRMEWAANSQEVVMQHLNRLQNTNRVLIGDATTGDVRTVLVEHDEAWLDVIEDLQWLDDGEAFTWVSERDGWRHLYVISRSGSNVRLVTPGEYDVVSVQRIDERGGWVYFIAAPENPTRRFLYRVPLRGGAAERLTPTDMQGMHSYQTSPTTEWAIHRYSRFGVPDVTDLVSLPDHEVARSLVDNEALRDNVDRLAKGRSEFLRVDNGAGVMLDCWLMMPPDLDPNKKYPILFYVYGEPWGQTVTDSWGGSTYLWHLMLTQQGYVVASVDNRGTPAPRGREWRKVIYRKIGVYAAADQAAALRAIVTQRPYIDADRVGIWGWSGGGSMTLNMMFRYPELYHVGMSVAPVPDLHYYDTIYQERYMGLPQSNAEDYKQSSPITFADRLQGRLLIVHGTGDDNVHYQGTEALINRLVSANRQFTMMAYPNRSHGIYEGRGTTLHLRTLLTEYLKSNLLPGAR
jgi:dipeptidyl-peptidase-4